MNTMKKVFLLLSYLFLLCLTPLQAEKTIGIYTVKVPGVEAWDPDSVKRGITGSEEAVIYLSQKLATLGYKVLVFGNPPANSPYSQAESNPRFVPVEFDPGAPLDIAVAWRLPNLGKLLKQKQIAHKVYFWPHDVCSFELSPEDIESFDDVLWLSSWQREQWSSIYPGFSRFTHVFGNGINPEQFLPVQERENPYSCIYASNYGRGLESLLAIWPQVKKQFPKATLDIYYGWNHWGLLSPEKESQMKEQLKTLAALDVKEHGLVGHDELTKAFSTASFWTYPCTAPETFCITALRAQLAGAVPVVLKQTALVETSRSGFSCQTSEEYLSTLTQALSQAEKISLADRVKMGEFVKQEFTWEKIASKWKTLFEPKQTICLNLIIKSNSPQLHKNLHSVKHLIDYWVVIDESFSKEAEKTVRDYFKGVPGEFYVANLGDKSSSLSRALALSKGKGDYVLLLDSNEEIIFSEEFKLPALTQDCYYSISHPDKALLINNHLPWTWNQSLSGQIHSPGISEQLVCAGAKPMKLLPGVISSQEDKVHLSDPFSLFTLAQSHMEAQEYEAAFKGYEKVLALKDPKFPLYPPFYFMGLVGEYLKKGSEEIMTYYSQAYQSNTLRAEPLFRMAVYSANQQNYILGYTLAKLALSLQNPKDTFFNEDWIYHYGSLFILGNCAFNLGKFEEAKKAYEEALTKADLPANLTSEIQKNLALANTQLEELKQVQ